MVINRQFFYISPELYLEGERVSPIKHEYRKGQVYTMVGAKKPHIVVHQDQMKIECYHRNESGIWLEKIYNKKDQVIFSSINYSLDIEEIYRKVPGLN